MSLQLFTKNKIDTIKNNDSYGILIEVGAGMPVYNELCMHPNTASKIVMYAESPNSWKYNQMKYDHADLRAISPDICKSFIENTHYAPFREYSFILTNTIQIANNKETQTHGWFGLYYNDTYKYYHFTILNNTTDRKYLSKLIAKIGLDILASQNNVELLENGYIDQILDENLEQLPVDTLCAIVNAKLAVHNINNTSTVFTKENKIIRINEYLRSIQNNNLVLFKGSFNPIHKQHINLLEGAQKALNIDNVVLCISIYNRDINKQVDTNNLYNRIKILNELGYTVIIDCLGYYHYSYTSLISNVDFKNIDLNYIMGSDIIERFLKDENVFSLKSTKSAINEFNTKWNKCKFHYVCREDSCAHITINGNINNVHKMDVNYDDISSTVIRELLQNNEYDKIKELVGEELTNLYKKHK